MTNLSEKEKKILLYIGHNGPQTKYQLAKGLSRGYAGIYRDAGFLVKRGVLSSQEIGKARTGLPKRAYGLTLVGFCLAIKNADQTDYEKIVTKWAHLDPLLLEKWPYFKAEMGQNEALQLIAQAPATLNFVSHSELIAKYWPKPEYEFPTADIFADALISSLLDTFKKCFEDDKNIIEPTKEYAEAPETEKVAKDEDWMTRLLAHHDEESRQLYEVCTKDLAITERLVKKWLVTLRKASPELKEIANEYVRKSREKLEATQEFQLLMETGG